MNKYKILLLHGKQDVSKMSEYLRGRGHWVTVSDTKQYLDDLGRFDFVMSFFYRYILKADQIDGAKHGVANFHPSYLPFGRGANPNVWAIIEGTVAGVTLHWIDSGVDTGPIIAQKQVGISFLDTGQSVHGRTLHECYNLFYSTWPKIEASLGGVDVDDPGFTWRGKPQDDVGLTRRHAKRVRDFEAIKNVGAYTQVINILRALTFLPYNNAYFLDDNGRKVYLRVEAYYDDEPG